MGESHLHSRNREKTGASEGLWDRLDRRMDIESKSKCICRFFFSGGGGGGGGGGERDGVVVA